MGNNMKYLIILFLIICYSHISYSQNASNFFPNNPGFKWLYKETHLDQNNIPGNITYRIDSFATINSYNGNPENFVYTKNGLIDFDQVSPYTDSLLTSSSGTDMYNYLNLGKIDSLFSYSLNPYNNWYDVFRFGSSINQDYLIYSSGYTVNNPITINGTRLSDVVINSPTGYVNTKRFVINLTLYTIIGYFHFMPIWGQRFSRKDSVWIGPNNWIMKEVIPSFIVSGTDNYYVLGKINELTNPLTGIIQNNSNIPQKYKLYNNYPNPFNPSTTIKFDVSKNAYVDLEVFDETGKKVADLFNGELNAGQYQFNFNAENLSSGSYFCKLSSDNFSQTMRMILIK